LEGVLISPTKGHTYSACFSINSFNSAASYPSQRKFDQQKDVEKEPIIDPVSELLSF
jgi:hypothetical protein